MLTDEELLALLRDMESAHVERTESAADPDRLRQAICAFANDLPHHQRPGVLFVGVTDKGDCAGLAITDRLLLTLSEMRSDGNILPLPVITVQKKVLDGCEMAVVVVQPAAAPPVRYKGVVWVRVGPRRATASADDERTLTERRRSAEVSFDLSSVPSATLADLDLEIFTRTYLQAAVAHEVLLQNERPIEQQLASLRFSTLAGPQEPLYPTVTGLMVLGRDPRRFVPGFYVQFLRLAGSSMTDAIRDQKEIDGPLPDLMRRLDDVLKLNITTPSEFTSGPLELRRPDYPPAALQQLARNAIMHRNYQSTAAPVRIFWFTDRIEIHSPGGPYGQVNSRNFGEPGVTDYRNPFLAEAMKNLGYVQRFGVGIQTAQRELAVNGNPPLAYQVDAGRVVATVRCRP